MKRALALALVLTAGCHHDRHPRSSSAQPPRYLDRRMFEQLGAQPSCEHRALPLTLGFRCRSTEYDPWLDHNHRALAEVLRILREDPSVRALRVVGHASFGPEEAMASELSRERAMVIARVLVEAGVEAGRLLPVGVGTRAPLAVEADPCPPREGDGFRFTRRVDFTAIVCRGGPP